MLMVEAVDLSLILILITFIVLLTLGTALHFAQTLTADPYTYPENSSPYGVPFKDWTAKWAKWIEEIPKSQNWNFQNVPGVKYTPKDCSFNQAASSPVFFLPWVGIERG